MVRILCGKNRVATAPPAPPGNLPTPVFTPIHALVTPAPEVRTAPAPVTARVEAPRELPPLIDPRDPLSLAHAVRWAEAHGESTLTLPRGLEYLSGMRNSEGRAVLFLKRAGEKNPAPLTSEQLQAVVETDRKLMAARYGENLEHLRLESDGEGSGTRVLPVGYNSAVSQKLNRLTLEKLDGMPIERGAGARLAAVPLDEIDRLYDQVASNPVGSLQSLDRYDPARIAGLCYGRAMIAHLEALQQGVAKSAIKKVWMVGSMKGPAFTWNYHVATAIRSLTGQWMVIDPFFGRPLALDDWYQILRDANGARARLYVTDPSRLSVTSPDKYTPEQLKGDDRAIFGFYADLLRHFRAEARQIKEIR